ncbi:MAG: DUF4252 domain-containing protein [Bacteroidota bacterium]
MKYLLFFCLFALAAPALNAQNKTVREFIREHRKGEENIAMTIPGFLIGLAGQIGELASDDEEEQLLFSFAREFGTIRFVTFDNRDFNTSKDIRNVIQDLVEKHDYEEWATVRTSSGEEVRLTVKMKKERVHEIVAVVSESSEDRTIFAHFKTDFSAEELGDVFNRLLAEN